MDPEMKIMTSQHGHCLSRDWFENEKELFVLWHHDVRLTQQNSPVDQRQCLQFGRRFYVRDLQANRWVQASAEMLCYNSNSF